jgi:hypothetical protein
MSDTNVNRWKQEGSLFVWRFQENIRNYPGWHLSADHVGANSIIDLLDRMLAAQWGSEKLLKVMPPPVEVLRVANNMGGKARWESPHSMLIKYPKGKVTDDYWSLEGDDELVFAVGQTGLSLFRHSMTRLLTKEKDFSIGPPDKMATRAEWNKMCLWFW